MERRESFPNLFCQHLRGTDDQIIFPRGKLFSTLPIDLHRIFNGECNEGLIPKVQRQPERVEPGSEVGRCSGNSDGDVHMQSCRCEEVLSPTKQSPDNKK